MSRAFLRTLRLEFCSLLGKKAPWLVCGGFCLAVLAVRLLPALRQSYLPAIRAKSLLLVVLEFLLPYFLAAALCVGLLPAFAGAEERRVQDTANPCLLGRRGRSAARLLAAGGYALLVCLGLAGAAALLCGIGDAGAPVTQIEDVILSPAWPAGRHAAFAVLSLCMGAALLALLLFAISAAAGDLISAAGTAAVLLLFEFLFHRFSFPLVLREINLWVFFRPYYFFILELFPFSPPGNLLTLTGVLAAGGGIVCLAWGRMHRAGH